MATASAGLQSELDVNASPTVPGAAATSPHIWSWIWFILAVLTIGGFHIRMFGRPVPPTVRFP